MRHSHPVAGWLLLTEGTLSSLEHAHSYAHAQATIKRIASFEKHLSKDQILRMLIAARDNSQVREAINVPSQIQGIASRAKVSLPEEKEHAELDDDIPF